MIIAKSCRSTDFRFLLLIADDQQTKSSLWRKAIDSGAMKLKSNENEFHKFPIKIDNCDLYGINCDDESFMHFMLSIDCKRVDQDRTTIATIDDLLLLQHIKNISMHARFYNN